MDNLQDIFPDITETIRGLLNSGEPVEEVLEWSVSYFTNIYKTNMEDVVRAIVGEIFERVNQC